MNLLPSHREFVFGSVSFSMSGLSVLFTELTHLVKEQAELDLSKLVKQPEQDDDAFLAFKQDVRENFFRVEGFIQYSNGDSREVSSASDFTFDKEGPFVTRVWLSNSTSYSNRTGREPIEYFELNIDFSLPELLDAGTLVSSATPNQTKLVVRGVRSAWRTAVENAVRQRLKPNWAPRTFFHKGFVYDLGLMLIGFPLAFYVCWWLSGFIQAKLGSTNFVVVAAAYVYVGMIAVWAYRIFFSYTKWAFPMVELSDQATLPRRHRKFWWALIAVISGKLFWDAADPFLSLPRWWGTFSG